MMRSLGQHGEYLCTVIIPMILQIGVVKTTHTPFHELFLSYILGQSNSEIIYKKMMMSWLVLVPSNA